MQHAHGRADVTGDRLDDVEQVDGLHRELERHGKAAETADGPGRRNWAN